MWAGVDRRWGGRRAGWLLVRGWTGGWIETRGDGCRGRREEGTGRREEVARLFVCQPRWDPLPIHSPPFLATSATAPARPALFSFNYPRRTLRTGTTSADVFAEFALYVYVCLYIYIYMYVYACERSRALIYVAPMCYTLQTSPPCTRGYSMCRICS